MFERALNMVDAVRTTACIYCGAQPGQVCRPVLKEHIVREHISHTVAHHWRVRTFMRWAKRTGFVPNHLVGENDKDLKCSRVANSLSASATAAE